MGFDDRSGLPSSAATVATASAASAASTAAIAATATATVDVNSHFPTCS